MLTIQHIPLKRNVSHLHIKDPKIPGLLPLKPNLVLAPQNEHLQRANRTVSVQLE